MVNDADLRLLTRTIKGLDETVKKLVKSLDNIYNAFSRLEQDMKALTQEQEEPK